MPVTHHLRARVSDKDHRMTNELWSNRHAQMSFNDSQRLPGQIWAQCKKRTTATRLKEQRSEPRTLEQHQELVSIYTRVHTGDADILKRPSLKLQKDATPNTWIFLQRPPRDEETNVRKVWIQNDTRTRRTSGERPEGRQILSLMADSLTEIHFTSSIHSSSVTICTRSLPLLSQGPSAQNGWREFKTMKSRDVTAWDDLSDVGVLTRHASTTPHSFTKPAADSWSRTGRKRFQRQVSSGTCPRLGTKVATKLHHDALNVKGSETLSYKWTKCWHIRKQRLQMGWNVDKMSLRRQNMRIFNKVATYSDNFISFL